METPSISNSHLLFIFLALISCFWPTRSLNHLNNFFQCMSSHSSNSSAISNIIYTPNNSSYSSILKSSIRNLRFASPSTPKPLLIITPLHESQIQAAVLCSKENEFQIRTRSGGHDYEGLSYASRVPFVVIDLIHLSRITIDTDKKTAWVQTGATIGQLYYRIGQESRTLAFPAGTCPTVGVGGHFSGGGYGPLLRKYGLAADNIVDAHLVDVNGKILDRKSMGEEVFWGIRGGGGASFGVITAWKLNLVPVPEIVTVCELRRTLDQNATKLVHRWQYIAPNLEEDITFMDVTLRRANLNDKTLIARFSSLFLGGVDGLLDLLEKRFPELGLVKDDCNEVSWVQSALFFGGYPINSSTQVLASRVPLTRLHFKAKSDYVREPISEHGIEEIWKFLSEEEADRALLIFTAYGGRMEQISEHAIPFPHREGNLYKIQHLVYWDEVGTEVSEKHINWIRRLYDYMTPFVSKSPRAAYINYRDLDLGVNNDEVKTSCAKASVWGLKYFKNNFGRLVRVKSRIDPDNFFRNEQSIPSLYS